MLLSVSKCFVMLDMPIDGLMNTQNLQVMQYRSANFLGKELGTYRLRNPYFLLLTLISIMWVFLWVLLVCFVLFFRQFKSNQNPPKTNQQQKKPSLTKTTKITTQKAPNKKLQKNEQI